MEDIQASQSSQQQTQSTQAASQPVTDEVLDSMWGYLEPCSREEVSRISFFLDKPSYKLGRRADLNDYVLTGMRISGEHCTITWDRMYKDASVTVLDTSLNGTFINGNNIGRNNTAVLRNGSEISFSSPSTQPHGSEDYRFTYRHTANPPTTTLETKYDLLTRLGEGSYGFVTKAICRSTGAYVAVKILKNTKTLRDKNLPPRSHHFRREIEILQRLKHQNICELKEVFFQDDCDDIGLVLELVEGGDLLGYLVRHAPLGEVEAQDFTYQICDAVTYIHSQSVAHRDLKPENILLTKDRPPIVKVADFGLAKFVDDQTIFKTLCGSPAYLAPEVVYDLEGYDNLVDSWSVGVIVFSMLTNRNPFVEDQQKDWGTRILERTINWKLLANENASPEATHFIRSLLQVDPRRRMPLTNVLKHPWFKTYTPVYGSKNNFGNVIYSNNTPPIPSVPANNNPRPDVDLHIGPSAASSSSVIPVDAAIANIGLIARVPNQPEHVALTALEGAYTDHEPSSFGLGSDEYVPGLLKDQRRKIVAEGDENKGVNLTADPRQSPHLTHG